MRALKTSIWVAVLACLLQGQAAWATPRVMDTLRLKADAALDHPVPIASDPDDGSIYVGGYNSGNVLRINPQTKKILAEVKELKYVYSVKVAGGRVYVSAMDQSWTSRIFIYDRNLALIDSIVSPEGWVHSFTIDAQSQTLYYGTWGKFCKVNLSDLSREVLVDFGSWVHIPSSLVLDEARNRLYVTLYHYNNADAKVVNFDLSSREVKAEIPIGKNPAGYDDRYDSDLDGDNLFVTQMYSSSITVVNVASNQVVKGIPNVSWPQRLVADPARHRLYVVDNYTDKFHVIDTLTLERVKSFSPGDDPSGVCLDAARNRIYTANVWTQDVSVIDRQTEDLVERISFAPATPLDVQVDSEKGVAYVSNGSNGGVYLLDTRNNRVLDKINFYDYSAGLFDYPSGLMNVFTGEMQIADAPDGSRLAYVLDEFNQAVAVLNLTQGRFVKHIVPEGLPSSLARYEGKVLFPYASQSNLYLGSYDGGQITALLLGPGDKTQGVAVNPKTGKAYVADYGNHQVIVVDLAGMQVLKKVTVGNYPACLAVDPETNRIYVSNYGSDTLSILDGSDDSLVASVPVGKGPWGLRVNSEKGRVYVVNSSEDTLTVVHARLQKAIAALPVGPGSRYCGLDVSNQRIFVAGQSSGTVTVVEDLVDNNPPSVSCPAPISKIALEPSGIAVEYPEPSAKDDTDPSPRVTAVPASGSVFPVGVTTVTVTTVDSSGNESSCSFAVTVRLRTCAKPVGDLAAVSLPRRRIELTWTLSSAQSEVAAYRIYGGKPEVDFSKPLAEVSAKTTRWVDEDLVNGVTYRYVVRALHVTGCEEQNTNLVSATAYNSPPCLAARIKSPQNGKKVSGERLTITAEETCDDSRDVEAVRFEFKPALAGEDQWALIPAANREHSNPDERKPYFIHWNIKALPDGEYRIRAVALDRHGNADANPSFVTIRVDRDDPDCSERVREDGAWEKKEKLENHRTNTVVLSNDNLSTPAQVRIPAGALDSEETRVTVQLNPLSVPKPDRGMKSIGANMEIKLENGQSKLGEDALLVLPYLDNNSDGIVDGTDIREKDLAFHYYNPKTGKWEKMGGSRVDAVKKTVSAPTSHFSLFGLFSGGEAADADADGTFRLGEVYFYPNPAGGASGSTSLATRNPTLRAETGLADRLELRIYDLSGEKVYQTSVEGSPGVLDGQYAYEQAWDVSNVPSGVYVAVVSAVKSGQATLKKTVKVAVIK